MNLAKKDCLGVVPYGPHLVDILRTPLSELSIFIPYAQTLLLMQKDKDPVMKSVAKTSVSAHRQLEPRGSGPSLRPSTSTSDMHLKLQTCHLTPRGKAKHF